MRKLIELEFFEVAVLSFQELSPDFRVQPVGRIALNHENELLEDEAFEDSDHSGFELAPAMA